MNPNGADKCRVDIKSTFVWIAQFYEVLSRETAKNKSEAFYRPPFN
jgi:hypothetical protein